MAKKTNPSNSSEHKKFALISVFDKTGIVEFSKTLIKLGYRIISTGGTAKVLSESNIPVIPIQEITGNPESFDGRMKTISFQIESGILFDRSNKDHVKEAKDLKIKPIDIVVCNLYPFEHTIKKDNVKLEDAVENIDVGGPTMIGAAAKNFNNVLVVVDPKDYQGISEKMQNQIMDQALRRQLASKAFYHLSFYDSQIAKYLSDVDFPDEISLPGRKLMDLRYGENAHQKAAVYIAPNSYSLFEKIKRMWGRELSLTNVTDINAGIEVVRMFKQPSAVVIKHNNPCGIALGKSIKQALRRAIDADPESAFGGVIVLNQILDLKTAKEIGAFKDERKGNIDIVAVPNINDDALEFLKKVRKTMGIYSFGAIPKQSAKNLNLKWIDGGFVLQTPDLNINISFKDWKVVTKKKPTKKQFEQMKIAWKFISRIKSNAILVMDPKLPMTRGIGSGQTSRVRSVKIAIEQAGKYTKNAILASDSFFPFDDSVKLAAKAGIAAIVQQGGSINDKASIEAADREGIAMVVTGRRAFWH